MNVIKTSRAGRPDQNLALDNHAQIRRTPVPPSGPNLKFRELFHPFPPRPLLTSQVVIKEMVNKLTK